MKGLALLLAISCVVLVTRVLAEEIIVNGGAESEITVYENTRYTHPGWFLKISNANGRNVSYSLKASDSDSTTWKKFTVEKINATTSLLKQNDSFDYETLGGQLSGKFKIVANESNSFPEESIRVFFKDTNDNVPQFTNLPDSANVSEATGTGATVFTVEGKDLDRNNDFNQITFSIIDGNSGGYFKLVFQSQTSVRVVVNSTLDHDLGNYVINLTIKASDVRTVVNPVGLSSTSYLVITITDADDKGASFTKDVFGPVTIPENSSPGSFVTQVTAYDKDRTLKHPITYEIVTGTNPNGMFSIDSSSGNITVNKTLDAKTQSMYALLVSATTTYHDPVHAQVVIELEDSNTHPPNFTSTVYTAQVPENAEDGTLVTVVQATDDDEGDNAVLSYSLEGVEESLFFIQTVHSLGYIYLNGSLDYDVKNVYNFTVFATETLTNEKYNDSSLVIINVTEILVNANNPVFSESSYLVNVTEEENAGHVVQVAATDSDKGHYGHITYSIIDGSYGMFSIDSTTGWINTTTSLNREDRDSYILVVRASDGDTVSRRTDVLVVVTVLDANDNSPTFVKSNYSGLVVENSNFGNTILAVQARDSDEGINAVFGFSVVGGDGKFSVFNDGNTGYIIVNGSLDYEMKNSYTFTVVATESSTTEMYKSNTTVTITLIDVNDNSPLFSTVSGYSASVAENSPNGSSVLTVSATDQDSGLFGQVTYGLVTQSIPFSINSSSGEIAVNGVLDRENKDSYTITVKAEDGGQPSLFSYTNIIINITDINDNKPVFSNNTYTTDINEDLDIGSSVVTVVATDADKGQNSLLTYSLQGGNGLFDIDDNGVIRVNGSLDYETTNSYTVTVTAKESLTSEAWNTSCTVVINLNDVNEFDPEFSKPSYYASIDENEPAGSAVATVQASDNDGVFKVITYSIVSGDDHGNFKINHTTGAISTTGPIDREITDSFILKIQASDNGTPNRTTESFVVIDVFDKNDNSPIFSKSLYNTTIPENLPVGTTVLAVKATDLDVNSTNSDLRYFIVGADFKFDVTSSGHIYVNDTLDFETKTMYSFTIFAEESGTSAKLQHNASVVISLEDINEFDPVFTQSGYYGNFSEDSVIGASGIQIKATDMDAHNTVTYSIIHGNNDGFFSINTSSGVISTAAALDYEIKNQFTLTVQAKDSGSPVRSSEVTVVIDILDVNDNMPVFLQSNYSATVLENTLIGSTVLTVKAQDKDEGENAQFDYYIVGGDGKFGVKSDGSIVTMATLDYETKTLYSFMVFANETNSSGPTEANATVTIVIRDVNEFNPVFTDLRYIANVSENSGIGTSVVQVVASDNDGLYHGLTYSIVDGDNGGKFKINSSTGLIITNGSLDREKETQYILKVRAEDNGTSPARTAETVVIINVVDVSDHEPVFLQSQYNATVFENIETGTTVLSVTATDDDKGANAKIRYYIGGGDGTFRVTSDGNIVVNASLNYESIKKYEFQVIAEESEATTSYKDSTNITIFVQDVNEYNPVFGEPSYIAVVEDTAAAGTPLLQVSATDNDGFYNQLTYSIIHGNTAGIFEMNSTTGWLSVTNAFQNEIASQHFLTIRVSDNGIFPRTAEVLAVININETIKNASFLLQDTYNVTILENALVGSTVFKLNVRDAYDGTISIFSYEIVGGNGDFSVSSMGEINIDRTLDYESKSTYNFTVVVTEVQPASGLVANATVNIQVMDVNEFNPKFSLDRYQGNVSEDASLGTFIIQVSASDQDGDYNVLTYSITHGNEGNNFTINSTTGEIKTVTSLDRETKEQFILTVRAQDNGPSPRTSEVVVIVDIVDISDHPPSFLMSNYSANVFENIPVDTTVLTVKTTDEDQSDASLKFSVVGGDGKFGITSTGAVFVNGSLDYESVSYYSFQVVAEETSPNSHLNANATIYISVMDVNEFNPLFNQTIYSAQVKEGEAIGTSVTMVSASDQDKDFNILTYNIIAGNDYGNFTINNKTGDITIVKPLDRETSQQFILTVRAEDNGVPPRTSEVTVVIGILDANDHGPVFTMSYYNGTISEYADIGATVLVVQALDQDVTKADLDYKLDNEDTFRLETHFGLGFVIVNKKLDYEQKKSYSFMVYAVELTPERRNASVMVNVTILDENDNPPVFSNSSYSATIMEGEPTGTTVLNVSAIDEDSEMFGPVVFEIIGGDPLGNFSIDSKSGLIKTVSILDSEVQETFVLIIEAKDSGTPSLSETTTVTITVLDRNEVAPMFIDLPYSAIVYENTASGTIILTVQVLDKDQGKNGEFAYSLEGAGGLFSIIQEGNIGHIKVAGPLDYEKNKTMEFYVIAEETKSTEKRKTNATVMVTIKDVNDNRPVFEESLYEMTVGEFPTFPISVGTVKATDDDSGSFAEITYVIVHGDVDGNFTINNQTGEITTGAVLNRETLDRYVLTIQARDGGVPPRTGVTNVVVVVTDKNELPPVFRDTPYLENVLENEVYNNDLVLKVRATDPDLMSIKYQLEPAGKFSIEETTGLITVTGTFDREVQSVYNLTVTAIDQGGLNTSEFVHISVMDTNDNTPQFQNTPYQNIIPDNITIGVVIITVSATDQDKAHNGDIVYSLLGGEGKFSINQSSGQIYVSGQLDSQLKSSYKLQVLATDRGIPRARVNFTTAVINVTDSSNGAPEFESVAYVGEINEGVGNQFVLNVKANDPDNGILGKITYSITEGNTYNAFQINSTGAITSTMSLDYENDTQKSFDLTVTVTDTGGLTDTAQVRVTVLDVNDNAPEIVNIPSPAEVNVSDKVPADTLLFALQSLDLDSGINKEVEYFASPVSDNLTVDQNTGIIKAKTMLLSSVASSITLSVYVRDTGNPTKSSPVYNITFNIIPNPTSDPFVLPSLTEISIFENVSVNDIVATVNTSTTADSFSILFVFPNEGNFKIDQNGSLTLLKPLDRESVDSYSMLVQAMKGGEQALGYVSVTVRDVNDAAPKFVFGVYKGQIKEDVTLGSDVLQVKAVDEDEEGTVVYTISSGNSEGVFNISSTGKIAIAKLPDYETTTFFNLTVTASDGIQTSSSFVEITIIDVNDNSPAFLNSSYSVSIPEDTLGGTSILKVAAVDADGDIVFYSIAGDDGKFIIDSITGVITTTSETLDYEMKTFYNLTITAKDSGGLKTSVSVLVNLTNSNDNIPVFDELSYNVSVTENFSGTLPVTVKASDADTGSKLTYSIVGSSSMFTVDPDTGAINTTVPVDFENDDVTPDDKCLGVSVLTIKAMDDGVPPLSATTNVAIFVTDINDNAPVFSKSSYEEVIAEFHTGEVLKVQASDIDCGAKSEIRYSFTSDNGSALFQINETTGSITVKKSLNESLGTYFLNVSASNSLASPKLKNSVIVKITVIQNKNYAPVFDKPEYFFNVSESAPIGSSLGSVSATDVNQDKEGVFIYSIENPGYAIPFDIHPETGKILLVRKIDREIRANYTFVVTVKDFGETPLKDTTTVTITVNDVNDAIPIFPENAVNSYSVSENITIGSLVCVVQASDADAAQFGQPIYVIHSGNEEGYFRIDNSTGEIFLVKNLDREVINVYYLTIRAYNYGTYGSRKRRDLLSYSEIQIVINVTDINDSDPVFAQLNYVAGYKVPSEPGTNVTTVVAFDPDDGDNGKLAYSILTGEGAEGFSIDSATGLITTTENADQLTASEITLSISVRDSPSIGVPRRVKQAATVTVYKLPDVPLTIKISSDTDRETIIEILKNITGPGHDIIIDSITPNGVLSDIKYYVVKEGEFLTENDMINFVAEYCKKNEEICNTFGINLNNQIPGQTDALLGEDDVTVLEAVVITLGVLIGLAGLFVILLLCCLRRRKRYMPVYEPSGLLAPSKAVSFDERPHYFQPDPRNLETQEVEIHMGEEVDSAEEAASGSSLSECENTEAIAKVHAYMNHALMNDDDSTDSDSSDDEGSEQGIPTARVDGTTSRSSTEPLVAQYNITKL